MFNSQQCPKSNIPSGQCLKHFVSKYLVFWIILIWFNQFHNFSNSNVIFFYQVEKKPKKFHILIHTPLPPFLSCKGYARLKHHSDHTQFKWNCNGKFYGSYNLIFFLISMKILNKSILVEDSKGQSKSKRFYSQYSLLIFALITIITNIMF